MKRLFLPIDDSVVKDLHVGDSILINGKIYTGRDAVLPRVCEAFENNQMPELRDKLKGSAVFHTAVSPAGIGPTSSNKVEIEESIPKLSAFGVKFHLGKGQITEETIESLNNYDSVYAVVAPVSAYLKSKVKSQELIAFEELGMEAMFELEVIDFPAVVAGVNGKSIYDK